MKKLWLTVLILMVSIHSSTEAGFTKLNLITTIEIKYVDFRTAYNKVRKEEGYYSNHPKDFGKRTYAGITQKYNPDWYGWTYVNKYRLNQNQQVTGIDSIYVEFYVLDFYLDIWIGEGFHRLTNQVVADYLFDTRIHLSRKQTIKLLNKTYSLSIAMTEDWVDDRLDSIDLALLKQTRKNYYLNRIKSNPSQIVWKRGWLKRANKI